MPPVAAAPTGPALLTSTTATSSSSDSFFEASRSGHPTPCFHVVQATEEALSQALFKAEVLALENEGLKAQVRGWRGGNRAVPGQLEGMERKGGREHMCLAAAMEQR